MLIAGFYATIHPTTRRENSNIRLGKETIMTIESGFDIIDWNERLPLNVISLGFTNNYLRNLPSYRPRSKSDDFDTTYSNIRLIIEDIGDDLYHISICDYFFGRMVDLGEGTYEVELDDEQAQGWSSLERILTDARRRFDSHEIDLDAELGSYYKTLMKDNRPDSRSLETEFRKYLENEARSTTTGGPYSPATVYMYVNAVKKICKTEHLDWRDLLNKASSIRKEYEIGGCKEQLGETSNNTWRNAIRRFDEFASKRAAAARA